MFNEFTVTNNGVDLYCRRLGTGIPLLMIHGACVDSDFFKATAEYLSRIFSVIIYDRRGYTRSENPSDGNYSIAVQAEDAAAIIGSVGEPCHIIAHSAGTCIAMELAARYPMLLRQVLLYEPAPIVCLPENNKVWQEMHIISDLICEEKYSRALNRFLPLIGPKDERARPYSEWEMEHNVKNSIIFIQNEFDLLLYHPDYERLHQLPIVIGLGELSRDSHYGIISEKLADMLSVKLAYFPGRHNCAFDLPEDFACMAAGIFLSDRAQQSTNAPTRTYEKGLSFRSRY